MAKSHLKSSGLLLMFRSFEGPFWDTQGKVLVRVKYSSGENGDED